MDAYGRFTVSLLDAHLQLSFNRWAAMILQESIHDYSQANGRIATSFESIECECGCTEFRLFSDDEEGGAFVVCQACDCEFDLADSRQFIASMEQNICSCGVEGLEVMIGTAFHEGTQDPCWTYIGGMCRQCGLAGVYTDWVER